MYGGWVWTMRREWLYGLALVIGCGSSAAWAGTYSWTGGDGSSQYWSTGSNWSGGAAPTSASDTIIQFDVMNNPGTSTNRLQQDIANPFLLNEMTFGHNADVSYYLDGNPLQFVANGATQPMFRNYGWYDKYIYNAIQVPSGTTLRLINDTYNMRINGVISGDGVLKMEAQGGGGEWHLYAANSYTGGTIYQGTANANQGYSRLAVYASGGLGTGPVTLNGGNISTEAQAQPRAGLHFMTASTSFVNHFQLQADSPIFASATGISLTGNVNLNDKTLYLRGTGSATASGVISGTGSITKLDTGTWTLSGNNTYTGTTTVVAGTLLLGHPSALGAGAAAVQLGTSASGTENIALLTDVWVDHTGAFTIPKNITVNNYGGTITVGSNAAGVGGKYVVFSGTITLNNKDLHLKGANVDRTTFTGKITGTGNVYVDGPNRITFEGQNDFVGNVYLTAGTLQLTNPNVIPDTASIIMSSGSTLRLLRSEAINALDGAGTVTGLTGFPGVIFTIGAGNGSGSFSGTIQDGGVSVSLAKAGTGTQTLTGPLNYTGGTTVNGGTLVLAKSDVPFPSAGSTGQFGSAHTITINSGATLQVGGNWILGDGLQHTIQVNGGTLVFSNSDNYQGKIELTGGQITTTGGNRPWRTGNWGDGLITVKASSASSTIAGSLCFVGTASAAKTTFFVEDGSVADDLVVSAVIYDHPGGYEGKMALVKEGPGTMVLSGANTYTGGTRISAGTLKLSGGANRLATTGNITITGGTLDLGANTQNISGSAVVSFQGGGVQNGTINNTSTQPYDGRAGTVSAVLAGSAGLVKTGDGILTLTGSLNYTGGTTVNGGVLVLAQPGLGWSANGQFGSSGHVLTVNAGATLRLTERAILGQGQAHQLVINGGTVEFLHETYQSKIEMTGGRIVSQPSGTIVHVWRTGNWGNGLVTVKASGVSSTIEGRLSFVKTASATKTTFDVEDGPAVQDLVVSANIMDHGGYEGMELVKAGAGTMVLSGANTYLGPTTIQAGKLLLQGTHTPATVPGVYTVASGGTLGGTGRTNASVLVQGTLAPGASVGTLHTGSQTWTPAGVYQWEIQDVDAGPGVGWDLADITGSLTISATPASPFVIDVVSLGAGGVPGLVGDFDPLGVYSWEIARTTTGVVGFAPEKFTIELGDFQNYWHGGRWWVSLGNQGNSVFLNYAIPEPASGLLAALALGGLALWGWLSRKGKK